MASLAVQAENLVKIYEEGTRALDGFSLSAFEGEMLGLIGPNGAGKTTTIKILVGLLMQDAGKVTIMGYNTLADSIGYKKYIGYMPEAPALPEYLTTVEFLGYVGRIRGIEKDALAKRVEELLRQLELVPKANDTVATLSKGMRAKLAFAAATIHRPKVLILDEPLLGIDPAGQRLLKDQLAGMARSGCCILVSTHQLDTAERLCTRVSIINRGRNVATGDLAALRSQAHAGEHQTLEEIFLKLTEEAGMPEPEMPRRKGLFSRRVS
ncbi:MAG: ABC transporter ATP-binding protein [Candidatus Thermoplasmatota archaeon]|nr:ABC transporter ATP-binding protein [Candidatus Thermoplasmatota archaeon]